MTDISLETQALAVESAAVNQRSAVEHRTELAARRLWNADLLPADRRYAAELAAAAATLREAVNRRASRLSQTEGGER